MQRSAQTILTASLVLSPLSVLAHSGHGGAQAGHDHLALVFGLFLLTGFCLAWGIRAHRKRQPAIAPQK